MSSAVNAGDVTGAVAYQVEQAVAAATSSLRAEFNQALAGFPQAPGNSPAAIQARTFGGRLTLQAGSATITRDQIGATKLFYAPDGGGTLPVKLNGAWAQRSFLASRDDQIGLTLDLAGSSAWQLGTLHDVFAIERDGIVRLVTRQWDAGMFPTESEIAGGSPISTGTGSSPWLRLASAFDGVLPKAWDVGARIYPANTNPEKSDLVNCIGRAWDDPKKLAKIVVTAASNNMLQNGGSTALMTKAIASNDGVNWTNLGFYYLDASISGGRYEIPINEGNQIPYRMHEFCVAGGANASINIAGLQFMEKVAPVSRRLVMDEGILVNDAPMMVQADASTALEVSAGQVFLGVIAIDDDAPGRVTAHVSYGPDRKYNVWNAYNQKQIKLRAGVVRPNASSYVLSANRWQLVAPGFSLRILQGLEQAAVPVVLDRGFFINAAPGPKGYEAGIAVDNVSVFSGTQIAGTIDSTGTQLGMFQSAHHDVTPFAGVKQINAIERVNFGPGIVSPFVDLRSTSLRASWQG